jgi:hypothetical protein
MLLAAASFSICSRLLSAHRRVATTAVVRALMLPAFLFAVVIYVLAPALA